MTDQPKAAPVQDDDAEMRKMAAWLRKRTCDDEINRQYQLIADALERAASRLSPTPDTGLIEALKKCRDKFSDYAAQHEAKWRTEVRRDEAEARNEKMIRNREMAEMCDTALAKGR